MRLASAVLVALLVAGQALADTCYYVISSVNSYGIESRFSNEAWKAFDGPCTSSVLTWTPPTHNEDGSPLTNLAGYRIRHGVASGLYTRTSEINDPSVTSFVVDHGPSSPTLRQRAQVFLSVLIGQSGGPHVMALPTTNLTLHLDASDTDKLFTTFSGSGTHTGTPGDTDDVQVWDEESDGGVTDVAMVYSLIEGKPSYAVAASPFPLPSLRYASAGSDALSSYTQTAGAGKAISNFIAAGAKTIALAIHPLAVNASRNASAPWQADGLFVDTGGFFSLGVWDDSGTAKLVAYNFDGSVDFVELAIPLNQTSIVILTHAGGTITLRLHDGSNQSVSSGDTSSLAGRAYVGSAYVNFSYFDGYIGEIATYDAGLSGGDLTDLIDYFEDKWIDAGGGGGDTTAKLIGGDLLNSILVGGVLVQ